MKDFLKDTVLALFFLAAIWSWYVLIYLLMG